MTGSAPDRVGLSELAQRFDSDKGPYDPALRKGHGYTVHYEREFGRFRDVRCCLLEIGILAGASMRAWSQWFGPAATIVGMDIVLYDQALPIPDHRTFYYQGNVRDSVLCDGIAESKGPFSIVVDDGSHAAADQERAFENLWKHVAPGGLYVIEDLHTAFWGTERFQGDVRPFLHERIDDCLGRGKWAKWSGVDTGDPEGLELEIVGVRFYRNMVVLEKAAEPPAWPLPIQAAPGGGL